MKAGNSRKDGPLRAVDHFDRLAAELKVRTVYADMDGTLLGPGGSLLAGPDGPVDEPIRAVVALARAGIDLVLFSGRTADSMREAARLLGARAFMAELGGLIVYREGRGERVVENRGAFRGRGTPIEAMRRSGAAGYLLDEFAGCLEPHEPWAFLPRDASMLFRGRIDLEEARAKLLAARCDWLDLMDNGLIPGGRERFPSLDVDEVHTYHLVPRGVSKRSAVALDRDARGLEADECIALGDSPSDVDVATEVGAMFLVSNGVAAVAGHPLGPNVFVTERPAGLGFAEVALAFAEARPDTASSDSEKGG